MNSSGKVVEFQWNSTGKALESVGHRKDLQAKEATILKQVGFGGQSTQQEHNLYNLFTSARKRDQIEEPRTGMCLPIANIAYYEY